MSKQNTSSTRKEKAASDDPIDHYCRKEPYEVISDFFEGSSMIDIRKSCHRFVTTAFENDQEKTLPLVSLNLYFFQDLLRLTEAAHQIYKKERLAALTEVNFTYGDLRLRYNALTDKITNSRELPYYLPPFEWVTPRVVIAEFFREHPMAAWKHLLHRMIQSTTGNQPILSVRPYLNTNLWMECLLLHKLLEATWIIWMTELQAKAAA